MMNSAFGLVCTADCPADNRARWLALFLYATLYTIQMKIFKLILSFLFLGIVACNTTPKFITTESDSNPIVQKNLIKYHKGSVPEPIGYVNDFGDLLSTEQEMKLEKIISDYEKKTTREIVIVTVDSILPFTNINNFALYLSDNWAVGKSEKDNGLTLVFSKKLRSIRISTGKGTENTLTDDICKKIIDQTIIPEFKEGKYYTGIEKGLLDLIKIWD